MRPLRLPFLGIVLIGAASCADPSTAPPSPTPVPPPAPPPTPRTANVWRYEWRDTIPMEALVVTVDTTGVGLPTGWRVASRAPAGPSAAIPGHDVPAIGLVALPSHQWLLVLDRPSTHVEAEVRWDRAAPTAPRLTREALPEG